MVRVLVAAALLLAAGRVYGEDEVFRPVPGEFPPAAEAKAYRGELVFVDHVNRRGSLRLHVDGHFHEGRLHHFAMLPYGMVRYRGAPADLKDVPLGTVMYGRFYLPPDPKTSLVPAVRKGDVTQPPEAYAVLLEDGPSLCLREGKAWTLKEVKDGELVVALERSEGGEGLGGEHTVTVDGSTRFWRGRELLGLEEVGTWPETGAAVQLGLAWHQRYLYQQFHAADVWLDEKAMEVARERQRGRHVRQIRTRWMPGWVDAVEHGEFGKATVTVTLFGGMDASLYAAFKPGPGGKLAAAEATLRAWWPDHDGMDGRIAAVERDEGEVAFGSSGIRVRFEVPLVLEGFRPGRVVRFRAPGWPNVKPPVEERVRSYEERWPGTGVFER